MVHDHLGNPFETIAEMCKHYGITRSTYNNRKRLGWNLKDILEGKVVYDHNGNSFESERKMCEHYGITYSVYKYRIEELGMAKKEALETVKSNYQYKKVRDHTGKSFVSKGDMCKHWGISLTLFYDRINSGMSLKDALETPINNSSIPQIKCQDHKGKWYNSKQEMCAAYNINITTFLSRINSGMTLKEALETPVISVNNRIKEVKDHLGITYPTKKAMCSKYNVPIETYDSRIKKGWTVKEALLGKDKEIIKDHKGKVYKTKLDMCKAYNIEYTLFSSRIRLGWTLEKALTTPITVNVIKDHTGRIFNTIDDMVETWGITKSAYYQRLAKGWSLKKTLTTPMIIEHKLDAFGKVVKLKELEKEYNIDSWNIIYRTTKLLWDIEIALTVPATANNAKINIKFVGLDGQARYKVQWSEDYQTTREVIAHARPDLLELYDKAHPDGKWNPIQKYTKHNKPGDVNDQD